MRVLIVDGQGGGMGKLLAERLKEEVPTAQLIAVGTNALATAAMLKGGATAAATGENAVVFNSRLADVIVGPVGIVVANSMYGELTPKMAQAVGESNAAKVLIPAKRCRSMVVGVIPKTAAEYVEDAVAVIRAMAQEAAREHPQD